MIRCPFLLCFAALVFVPPTAGIAGQHSIDDNFAATASPGLTQDLQVVTRHNPVYPREARDEGVEGWVIVAATVDSTGNAYDYRVIDSSPTGYFESAALKAFQKWTFRPAFQDGVPVAAESRVRINFNLDD